MGEGANLKQCRSQTGGRQERGRQERGRHLVSRGDFGCDGKRLPKAVAQPVELFLVHRDLQEHSEHRRLIALESGGALHRVCSQRAFGFESLKVRENAGIPSEASEQAKI